MRKTVGWLPRAVYRNFHALMPVVCVDLVLEKGADVLLLRRNNEPLKGWWFIPGGRLMRNERIWTAASRIAKQETGLSAHVVEILGWDETRFRSDPFGHGRGTHTVNLVVRATIGKRSVPKLDHQHSEFQWIGRDSLQTVEKIHPRAERIINCGRWYEIDGVGDDFEIVTR